MATSEIFYHIDVRNVDYSNLVVEDDKHTADNQLKQKLRDINLIKYNPKHFTNVEGAYDLLGGCKTGLFILGFGLVGVAYRSRANALRGIGHRMGIWNNNIHFLMGAGVGSCYSAMFFVKWQVLLNDYFAQWLFKRYPKSKELDNKGIYIHRNKPCDEECYYFTDTYMNSYHL